MPDTYLKPFAYYETTHRPRRVLILLAALAILTLSLALQAPAWAVATSLLAVAAGLWLALGNPRAGTRLTADRLTFFGARFARDLSVRQIDHVAIGKDTDGKERLTIHLTNGLIYDPPHRCLPTAEVMAHELTRARIKVQKTQPTPSPPSSV